MTVQVNMLPRAYRLRTQRADRFKRWLYVCVLVAAGQILASYGLQFMAAETRKARIDVIALQNEEQMLNRDIAQLTGQNRALARKVYLANRLSGKHYWSDLLATVARDLPDNAVLFSLETDPVRGSVATPVSVNQAKNAKKMVMDITQDTARGLLISGIATDHESVAEFMRALNEGRLVGLCRLESTNRQSFQGQEGVAFTVRTQW